MGKNSLVFSKIVDIATLGLSFICSVVFSIIDLERFIGLTASFGLIALCSLIRLISDVRKGKASALKNAEGRE